MSQSPETILVLAGTREGRRLAKALHKKGYPLVASVVSTYGADLLTKGSDVAVWVGKLDEQGFLKLLQERNVIMVVDATHPYATAVSSMAAPLCREKDINYLRYERPTTIWPAYDQLYFTDGYEEAAQKAVEVASPAGNPVLFLAIGSKNLAPFVSKASDAKIKVCVRILPVSESLEICRNLGLSEEQVIAGHGPFSEEENIKMLKQSGASVLVTKDSGFAGGTLGKVEAAMAMEIPVVVVGRPEGESVLMNNSSSAGNREHIFNDIDGLVGKVEQLWNKR